MTKMLPYSYWIAVVLALAFIGLMFLFLAPKAGASLEKPADYVRVCGGRLDNEMLRVTIVGKENWDGLSIGRSGERGKYQLTRGVWKSYSTEPFWWASSPEVLHREETERVATAHIAWCRAAVCNLGLKESPYSFALVWNAGYGTVFYGRITSAQRQYAEYFENLYYDRVQRGL